MHQQEFETLLKLIKQFRESASTDASTQYIMTYGEIEELNNTIKALQEQYDFIYLGKDPDGDI